MEKAPVRTPPQEVGSLTSGHTSAPEVGACWEQGPPPQDRWAPTGGRNWGLRGKKLISLFHWQQTVVVVAKPGTCHPRNGTSSEGGCERPGGRYTQACRPRELKTWLTAHSLPDTGVASRGAPRPGTRSTTALNPPRGPQGQREGQERPTRCPPAGQAPTSTAPSDSTPKGAPGTFRRGKRRLGGLREEHTLRITR